MYLSSFLTIFDVAKNQSFSKISDKVSTGIQEILNESMKFKTEYVAYSTNSFT